MTTPYTDPAGPPPTPGAGSPGRQSAGHPTMGRHAVGQQAVGSDGVLVGTVTQVWSSASTGEPTWVSISTGPGAGHAVLAPSAGASSTSGRLHLAFPATQVHAAPPLVDSGHLTPEQETALVFHYWPGYLNDTGPAPSAVADGTTTLSEERLDVRVVSVPYARAALRIETTTEQVMVPVTVTRQHARLEFLELTDTQPVQSDRAVQPSSELPPAATPTPWVTLFAEEPVVTTRQVPVERVRLDVHRVNASQTITEVVGHEEIVVEHLAPTQEHPAATRTT